MSGVRLKTGSFCFNADWLSEQQLREMNPQLLESIIESSRFLADTLRPLKQTISIPALSNWHASEQTADEFASEMVELGQQLL